MKIVNDNLTGNLSLVDKVWNDAMETAALHCEERSRDLFSMNGGDDSWVWPAGRRLCDLAEEFRQQKRK